MLARLAQGPLAAFVPGYYYRKHLHALVQEDPALVWSGIPGITAEIENSQGEKITYSLNALGWRDREFVPFTVPRNGLVLGDSFSFGLGVQGKDRFSERLEGSVSGLNVWNLGVMGYAPDQYLLQAQKWLPGMPWSFLVLQLSNNDVADVAGHRWTKLQPGTGIPVLMEPPASYSLITDFSAASNLFAYTFLLRENHDVKDGLNRLLFSLRETLKLALKLDVPVILLQASDWGEPIYGKALAMEYQNSVKSLAAEFHAPLVEAGGQDLLPPPDLHWTATAHEKVAELLLPSVTEALRRKRSP